MKILALLTAWSNPQSDATYKNRLKENGSTLFHCRPHKYA